MNFAAFRVRKIAEIVALGGNIAGTPSFRTVCLTSAPLKTQWIASF